VVAVSFRCGHGATGGETGVVALRRVCPLCMLLDETHRSRGELLRKVAPAQRSALAHETRVGATYDWRCARGHDRYAATVRALLTGPGCPKCGVNAAGPSSAREAGVAFMNPGLRTRTSQFYGRQEVWPDILVPQLRIAVEYDDPGRSRRAHMGLKEASDLEKDEALREVGWEVVRIRAGGLRPLGPHSVVCHALTAAAVDEVVACMRRIRGDAAVDAIATGHPAAS